MDEARSQNYITPKTTERETRARQAGMYRGCVLGMNHPGYASPTHDFGSPPRSLEAGSLS